MAMELNKKVKTENRPLHFPHQIFKTFCSDNL